MCSVFGAVATTGLLALRCNFRGCVVFRELWVMPNLDRPVTASLMIDLGNPPLRTWTSIHVVHVEPPVSGLCRISKEATGRQKDLLQGDLPCKNEGESEGEGEGEGHTACYCVRAGCGSTNFAPPPNGTIGKTSGPR